MCNWCAWVNCKLDANAEIAKTRSISLVKDPSWGSSAATLTYPIPCSLILGCSQLFSTSVSLSSRSIELMASFLPQPARYWDYGSEWLSSLTHIAFEMLFFFFVTCLNVSGWYLWQQTLYLVEAEWQTSFFSPISLYTNTFLQWLSCSTSTRHSI